MVRACILKCKEYVIINPTDPNNQRLIRLFEAKHSGHPIITITLSEVKEFCKNVENKFNREIKI